MSFSDPVLGSTGLTPKEIGVVRDHLKEVLASHAFAGSKRTQDFLQLIVGHALAEDFDKLRERMIGAEMFGRPVGYDTGNDSVVRVKATELRKKLAQFYIESKVKQAVRIELPSGSYVPRFHFEPLESEALPTYSARVNSAEPIPQQQKEQSANGVAALSFGPIQFPATKSRRQIRILTGTVLGLVLLTILGYNGIPKRRTGTEAQPEIHSIAILPLENLSGDSAQEYFADGMTEDLINDLGQVSTLRVISLTSAMSYKGTKKKLPEIAHELAVDAVVEGGVLREGNQVRVSAQLVDARTDRPVWAHTYVRDMTGVLAWQGEVAQDIAEEIRINVTPQEQARLARRRSIDPQAQDLYLHGILQLDLDNCQSAVEFFTKALDKNPNYALPHVALATCYGRMGESGRMPYREAFTKQKSEAVQAIQLDDSLPEGHAELANAAMTLDWDWKRAASEFQRARELNPNSAPIHTKYAFYLVRNGQTQDAIAEVERGVDLDPVSWHSFHAEGFIYYFSRRYDQALSLIQRVRALDINPPDWSFLLGEVYAEKGQFADSIAAFLKSGDGVDSLGHLGNAYGRAGQVAAARRIIAQLQQRVEQDGVGRYEIALVYAGMGDKQEAFQWLEESYKAHDVGLVYLKIDPCLDPLRSDPRFDDLLQRVGFRQ